MVACPLVATLAGASYSTEVLVCLPIEPGPANAQETPLPDGSLAMVAVMVMLCPCPIVCELPPLKVTEISGGGVLVPPQPACITARRYTVPIHPHNCLLNTRSCSCILDLLQRFRQRQLRGRRPLLSWPSLDAVRDVSASALCINPCCELQ